MWTNNLHDAPYGEGPHICDGCRADIISSTRYCCMECVDFDLCNVCYDTQHQGRFDDKHHEGHIMLSIPSTKRMYRKFGNNTDVEATSFFQRQKECKRRTRRSANRDRRRERRRSNGRNVNE